MNGKSFLNWPIIKAVYKLKKAPIQNFTILLLLVLVALLAYYGFIDEKDRSGFELWYSAILDPLIAVFTAVAALVIAYQNYEKAFIEQLPRRLNMYFSLDGNIIAGCKEAYLSDVSDIRQWTLNSGKELLGGFLSFYPYLDQSGPIIKLDKDHPRRVYTCTIYLRSSPTMDPRITECDKAKYRLVNSGSTYIYWDDNEPTTEANEETIVELNGSLIIDADFVFSMCTSDKWIMHVSDDTGSPERRLLQLKEGSNFDKKDIALYLGPTGEEIKDMELWPKKEKEI